MLIFTANETASNNRCAWIGRAGLEAAAKTRHDFPENTPIKLYLSQLLNQPLDIKQGLIIIRLLKNFRDQFGVLYFAVFVHDQNRPSQ
jgi:hypothetical protein